jgi:hypothetical protein
LEAGVNNEEKSDSAANGNGPAENLFDSHFWFSDPKTADGGPNAQRTAVLGNASRVWVLRWLAHADELSVCVSLKRTYLGWAILVSVTSALSKCRGGEQ